MFLSLFVCVSVCVSTELYPVYRIVLYSRVKYEWRIRLDDPLAHLRAIGLGQRPHQIQLLALLVCINGRSLVMLDQLIQRMELALSNTVHVLLHMHPEVFVAAGCLQGNRVIAHLQNMQIQIKLYLSSESTKYLFMLTLVSLSLMRKSPSCPCPLRTVSHWLRVMAP